MVVGARVALLAVPVIAMTLGGCASVAPAATPEPTPLYPTSSPSETPTPSAGARNPDAPSGQCDDDALTVDVVPAEGGGAAGSTGYTVKFTNAGETSCTLQGFPGVSVVGHDDGTQLGPSADWQGTAGQAVVLAEGDTAVAALSVVDIGKNGGPLGDDCDVVGGDGWRVYAPHSYRAWFVADPTITACADGPVWLHLTGGVRSSDG